MCGRLRPPRSWSWRWGSRLERRFLGIRENPRASPDPWIGDVVKKHRVVLVVIQVGLALDGVDVSAYEEARRDERLARTATGPSCRRR